MTKREQLKDRCKAYLKDAAEQRVNEMDDEELMEFVARELGCSYCVLSPDTDSLCPKLCIARIQNYLIEHGDEETDE